MLVPSLLAHVYFYGNVLIYLTVVHVNSAVHTDLQLSEYSSAYQG
jgi:hypothetical protein